jgi:fructokinase
MNVFGAIEAGGTKFVCAVVERDDPTRVVATEKFPTTTPEETIANCVRFFETFEGAMDTMGIASFGPIDLDRNSPSYGFITSTPKPFWANADLVGPFARRFGVPVGFDTDVNGAALGEYRWGAAQGLDTFCYFTIGTGIGGGGMSGGRLLHGLVHPEMGHVIVNHDRAVDPFNGACPFHGDCFEGMAAGPAIEKRWGIKAEDLPADHPAWDLQAGYVADALRTVVCVLSPERIILGGGVMHQAHVLPMVRTKLVQSLNGYVQSRSILDNIDSFVVLPGLGDRAGVLGAVALAELALAGQ